MMNRQHFSHPWVLAMIVLVSLGGCAPDRAPATATPSGPSFQEVSFWGSLPRPDDAEAIAVGEEFDLGFVTTMIEPELFDFYTAWLSEQGWRQQAPTDAVVTLPRQVWRKDGAELLIEIQGLDERGRTMVWFRVEH